ncbi:hypothetical protein PBOI14_59600 [Pseudomonas sp. Boi14]|nr:hypothetical protein PBOI14_59600 [Pseudomonas sp. Boi14]
MEDMLGVQLFVRESRQALPTAIGLQVLAQARVMLEALAEVRRQVDAARGIPQGSVRLAGFPMVLATFLPPLLRRFKQLYPGIEVVQLEVSDDEVETLLEAQLVDLGVVLNPAPSAALGCWGVIRGSRYYLKITPGRPRPSTLKPCWRSPLSWPPGAVR